MSESPKKKAPFPGWNPTPKRSGWRNLMGCLFWPFVAVLVLGGAAWGIWIWHPWEYRAKVMAVGAEACPETGHGTKTTDQLHILGIGVGDHGSAVICVDKPSK